MSDLLQSHTWERFQRALGRRTWRVEGTLVIGMSLPFGLQYVYAPRSGESGIGNRESGEHIARIARESRAVFLRTEQCSDLPTPDSRLTTPRVLRRAVEPEWTWRVSLEPDEDAMLAAMHEKHRYNVRLAQRRGVRVSQHFSTSVVGQGHFDTFWLLLQDTAKRQGIGTHSQSYYRTMLSVLGGQMSDVKCHMYFAEREGVPCSAAVVAYHGDTATCLHGGSSHEHRQHMAPHLLHWTAMRDAKAAGMRWYDFGGVSPEATPQKRHPEQSESASDVEGSHTAYALQEGRSTQSSWSGITRFKQGFGGEVVHHPPTRDLVFRRGWYTILAWMARMRPYLRGLDTGTPRSAQSTR